MNPLYWLGRAVGAIAALAVEPFVAGLTDGALGVPEPLDYVPTPGPA